MSLTSAMHITPAAFPVSGLDQPIKVTFFRDASATAKREITTTLRGLLPVLQDTRGSDKASLPWLKLAAFGEHRTDKASLRNNANVLTIHGVEADYDEAMITVERAERIIAQAGLAAVIYTSPSHTPGAPKWRILCPTSCAMQPGDRAGLLARLNGLFVGALAPESFTLSQSYYYGAVGGGEHHRVVALDGRPIDLASDLAAGAIGRASPPRAESAPITHEPRPLLMEDGSAWGLGALRRACDAIRNAADGAKHMTLNREAYSIGGLVTGGDLLEGPARAALADALAAIRHRCDDFRAAERTLMQAFAAGMEKPRQPPPAMPERRQPFAEAFARVARDDTGTTYDAETGEIIDAPARTPRADGLPVIYFADVQPNLDAADFVEGLLIEGAMSVIYGPSNCGKTFFMTDLALHVAGGQKWRGKEIEAGGVIYCALEGAHGISNRIAAFKKEHGLEGKALPFAIVPVSINLLDPNADRVRLVETIKAAAEAMGCPVKLIVIDTLSRALAGGNENAPDDMGAVVASADFIRQTAKAHLAFVHHSGKDQAQGARGHSLLRAATDTEIEISRPDSESPSVARVTKQRELEIEGTFAFTLKTVELGTNRRGKPVTSCVVDPVDASAVQAGKARLSNGAAAALTALHHALIEAGQLGTDSTMPGARVVHLDVWRREFYARSHLETQEARKKAFQRAVKDLRDGQAVGVMNDFAWDARGQNDRDK